MFSTYPARTCGRAVLVSSTLYTVCRYIGVLRNKAPMLGNERTVGTSLLPLYGMFSVRLDKHLSQMRQLRLLSQSYRTCNPAQGAICELLPGTKHDHHDQLSYSAGGTYNFTCTFLVILFASSYRTSILQQTTHLSMTPRP